MGACKSTCTWNNYVEKCSSRTRCRYKGSLQSGGTNHRGCQAIGHVRLKVNITDPRSDRRAHSSTRHTHRAHIRPPFHIGVNVVIDVSLVSVLRNRLFQQITDQLSFVDKQAPCARLHAMAPSKPSEKVLESDLAKVTREIFRSNERDVLSVNLIRKRVQEKHNLDDDFFTGQKWKNKSKTIIKNLVVS